MKIAQGNTYIVKAQLKQIGMRWNGSEWIGNPDMELWNNMSRPAYGRRTARLIEQADIEFIDPAADFDGDINKLLAYHNNPVNY